MAQLVLTTRYDRNALGRRPRAPGSGQSLERRLQDYIASEGWTLGTVLASALLGVIVGMSRTRTLGEVFDLGRPRAADGMLTRQ